MRRPTIKLGFGLLVLALGLTSESAWGAKKKRNKKRPKPVPWEIETTYALMGSATSGVIIEELTNPENKVYQLPHTTVTTEFRPELVASKGQDFKLVLRPRGVVNYEMREKETDEHNFSETDSDLYMNEAYFSWNLSGNWQTVIGLQNYQWGPAELMSPSNPLFRDNSLEKTYFYETRGKTLVRLGYQPSQQASIVFLAEPINNGEEQPAYAKEFRQTALVKAEYADESLTNYLGIVGGANEDEESIYGAYGTWELFTGFSLYFDFSTRIGNRVYYPTLTPAPGFAQTLIEDGKYQTTSVGGMRYVTEGGVDLRVEHYRDTNAWSQDQRDAGRFILGAMPTPENLALFLNPGVSLPGKKFIYGSMRAPDLGADGSWTLSLRVLHSLNDNTEKQLGTVDTFIGDHFAVSAGLLGSYGEQNGELTQGYFWTGFLGGIYTF